MKYKYQLIFLGENEALFKKIQIGLLNKFSDLKLIEDLLKIIRVNNITEYSGAQPAYVVYSGKKENLNKKTKEILIKQKLAGNIILPVYIENFKKEIPKVLENNNGLKLDNNIDKICDLILEGFALLRKTRKVFISYKRTESSNIAIQLYESLENNNFDVFLDTHSVDKGEEFQEELWHRMTDCDVIIMLNTKGFLTSEWCNQELEKAHLKRIGIVHILWPDVEFENFAHLSKVKYLKKSDFDKPLFSDIEKGRLNPDVVSEIIKLVESTRARNLASRQDSLITEFTQAAFNNKVEVNLQYSRYITHDVGKGKKIFYIPTVGVPQSINCHNSQKLISQLEEGEVKEIHLIYDDMSIRKYWLEHLDWLNRYLKVKTIKKQNFNSWFLKFKA